MTLVMADSALSDWLGDSATARHMSFEADLDAMLRFEAELAGVQAEAGVIPHESAAQISSICENFQPDFEELKKATLRDGVVVPEFVSQLRALLSEDCKKYLHYGATSQDVVDTSLMMRLGPLLRDYQTRIGVIAAELDKAERQWGSASLMAYTRMRAALPCTVSDRIMIWRRGIDGASGALSSILEDGLPLQYAGPVGNLDLLGDKADAVCLALAEKLSLNHYGGSWQVERSPITDIANMLSRITTATAKIGSDICLMVQDGIDHVKLEGGKSSSMPHKINPVNAELLISLARHNATLLGGVGQASLHENERSGAGWTLEWITLPQMLFATGASLNASLRLLHSIRKIGLKSEL